MNLDQFNPFDVVCPTCGAKKGFHCWGNGAMRVPHDSREQLVHTTALIASVQPSPEVVVLQEKLNEALETIEQLRYELRQKENQ